MKVFLREYTGQMVLLSGILVTTYFIFLLFSLSMSIYLLLAALSIILSGIYFAKEAIYFAEQRNLSQENKALEVELLALKESTNQQKQALEEYFLMWVHQMKTPITASQLLLENSEGEPAVALRQELLQIENYTNMALNYLKLTNPDTDMVITKRTVHELLAPLLRKYRLHFIHHKITLHYEPIEALIVTEANLTSLMLEQLLNNALKYAKGKDIYVKFDAEKYVLTIEDTGLGIRSEDLPKIFDKGYSGFNGQLNQKSSGLGLYLVNLIAKRLDQPVKVVSKAGESTKFTVILHRARNNFA